MLDSLTTVAEAHPALLKMSWTVDLLKMSCSELRPTVGLVGRESLYSAISQMTRLTTLLRSTIHVMEGRLVNRTEGALSGPRAACVKIKMADWGKYKQS